MAPALLYTASSPFLGEASLNDAKSCPRGGGASEGAGRNAGGGAMGAAATLAVPAGNASLASPGSGSTTGNGAGGRLAWRLA